MPNLALTSSIRHARGDRLLDYSLPPASNTARQLSWQHPPACVDAYTDVCYNEPGAQQQYTYIHTRRLCHTNRTRAGPGRIITVEYSALYISTVYKGGISMTG